jgi:hypothetical protein
MIFLLLFLKKLKIIYSKAMIQLHLHFGKYLECAKCSQSMLGAEGIDSDAVFIQMITFLLLSPHSKEQQELTNQVLQDKRIKSIPIIGDLVKIFCRKELIRWLIVEQIVVNAALFASNIFADQNWKFELQKRVIEHVNGQRVCLIYSLVFPLFFRFRMFVLLLKCTHKSNYQEWPNCSIYHPRKLSPP